VKYVIKKGGSKMPQAINPACKSHVGEPETGHIKSERIKRDVIKVKGIKLTKPNERKRQKIDKKKRNVKVGNQE
jgi:hypothetical protein